MLNILLNLTLKLFVNVNNYYIPNRNNSCPFCVLRPLKLFRRVHMASLG